MGTIIVVDELEELENTILNYDKIVGGMENEMKSNNAKFNDDLSRMVEEMFGVGK